MGKMQTILAAVALVVGFSSAARAQEAETDALVAKLMDGVAWGMSPADVLNVMKDHIRDKYQAEADEAHGTLERDRIYERGRAEFRRIKDTYTVFDGRVTGWDISVVGPEFRQGSGESMMYSDNEQYRDYFFFARDRLWKCYREYKPEAFNGLPFDDVVAAFERGIGEAQVEDGVREPEGPPAHFARWQGAEAQLDAVDNGSHVVMVMSERKTVGTLAALRRNALPRGHRKGHAIVDSILLSDSERDALDNGKPVETALKR